MLHDFIVSLYGEQTYTVLYYIFFFFPVWGPFILGLIFWVWWVRFVQMAFNEAQPRILLEIKAPREVDKSPLAMEVVLGAFLQGHRESSFIARYWKGQSRPWFSLEIVSLGGHVHFYVWTEANMKNVIQSQFYSQYPGVEVVEVDDYVKKAPFDLTKMNMWAMQYEYNKSPVYPIKTYVDYGLDKDPKEEYKVDPLVSMIEFFGSIKKDEQIWFQFVIRQHKSEKRAGLFSKKSSWKDDAEKVIKKLREALMDEETKRERRPTKGESDTIAAIERSISKPAFDVGIRAIYWAPREAFDKSTPSGISSTFRLYNSESLNGFRHGYESDFTKLPWEDFRDMRVAKRKRTMMDAYKRRNFFFFPFTANPLIMNTEALATVYHIPGKTSTTPTFERIPSKKAQAPSNLPV